MEQHRFLSRVQNETESIGNYVAALRNLTSHCDFTCDCNASIADLFLRAQFIRGVKNSNIREKLLLEKELTFNKAVEIALSLETSYLDNQEIKNGSSHKFDNNVCKLARQHFSRSTSPGSHSSTPPHFSRSKSNHRNMKRRSFTPARSRSRSRIDYVKLGIADVCIKCSNHNYRSNECRVPPNKLRCSSCRKTGHVSKVCITTLLNGSKSRDVKTLDDSQFFNDAVDFNPLHDCAHISTIAATLTPFQMILLIRESTLPL